uniref:Uncharacterized protein n=1 Tax=Plectus sambesii TaxID=2011161 RepID=A0A914WPY7_9BILA
MRPDERVTEFIDDGGSSRSGGLPRSPSHQSSSSSSTAPGVPMALMSQSMTLPHGSSLRRENKPHPLMMTGKLNGMSVTMSSSSPKLNNRESELNTHRHLNGLSGETGKSIASPKLHQPFAMSEMLVEPVDDEVSFFAAESLVMRTF